MSLWKRFKERYPKADETKFKTMKFFGKETIMFIGRDENIDVFDGNNFRSSIYFSNDMKRALGLASGFPLELNLNTKPDFSIPAIQFYAKTYPLSDVLVKQKIYVTPNKFFNCDVHDIFTNTQITHHSGKESHSWLSSPNMKYFPQQLSFAIFCASTACGISNRLLFEDKTKDGNDFTDDELHLPDQIRSILRFHLYFTTHRILNEMGVPLPGDTIFKQSNNRYNITAYKSICAEFGIDPNSDFRFTAGNNKGLGSVYIWLRGARKTDYEYPGDFKFSDENGNLVQYLFNSDSAKQYEHFVANNCFGITKAGQARLNQSIESLTYCILGSQVDLRSSIFGDTGSAKEVQREFLNLFESVIIQNDLSNSVQRFELSIQEAKVKLNLAISPGCWLMASDMILNTESKTSYNNFLRHASQFKHLGLTSDVNNQTKVTGIRHSLGASKVSFVNQNNQRTTTKEKTPVTPIVSVLRPTTTNKPEITKTENLTQHENNLAVITISAGVLIYFLFKT